MLAILYRRLQLPVVPMLTFSLFGLVFAAPPQSTRTAAATIRAEGRGAPSLFLRDGNKLATTYIGDSTAARSFGSGHAQPVALSSADFDEDGMPDLAAGYAAVDGSGFIVIHRSNVDALWPYGQAVRAGEPSAFLPQARVFTLPTPPDFLGAGDFDADGHWDLVAATAGGRALYFLRGDGRGGFAQPERIELPGALTAFASGEVNRVDGLTDLAVGVSSGGRAQVLVFESPRGALRAVPETFAADATVSALAMLPLGPESFNGLAVGAGNQLIAIHGRDRMLAQSKAVRETVAAAEITRQDLPFVVRSLAAGRFTSVSSHVLDLVALGDDGKVHFLERADAEYQAAMDELPASMGGLGMPAPTRRISHAPRSTPRKPASRELVLKDAVLLPAAPSAESRLLAAHTSITGSDDVLLTDRATTRLHVLSRNADGGGMRLAASLDSAAGAPVAALAMRLSRSAQHGLVVLHRDQLEPSVILPQTLSIYTVTNTQDPGAGQFNTQNTSIPGSLRWAISSAIDAGGTSIINFDIPVTDPNYDLNKGTFTITPLPNTNCDASAGVPCQGLPPLPPGCVIDGYTQPGGTLNGISQPPASPNSLANGDNAVLKIVISGTVAGTGPDGIWLFNGNGTVRGLIITGFNSALNPGGLTSTGGFGVNADSGNNIVEGNFLGVDSTGTLAAPNYVGTGGFGGPNLIGGATPQARNLLSGNTYTNFGSAVSSAPNTYFVQGNYIGTDRSGTVPISLSHGGLVEDGVAMVIGGATAGAGNLVSGNNVGISINYPAGNSFTPNNNLVQGNLVGTDPTGAQPAGNLTGVYIDTGENNLIGGTTPALRNIISGNQGDGIQMRNGAQSTTIQGNYIGVDITGSKKLTNAGSGITNTTIGNAVNAYGTLIGGESPGAGNVVSGSGLYGMQFGGTAGPLAASILGNLIGTDASGNNPIGNGLAGISVIEGASSMTIGGTDTPARNVIAYNGGQGVAIDPANQVLNGAAVGGSDSVVGNLIFSNGAAGVSVISGAANRISQNSIFSNAKLGIDLDVAGVLTNSACQAATNGANGLQNAPVLIASPGATTLVSSTATDPNGNTSEFSNCAAMNSAGNVLNVVGSLNSRASTTYTIEFFQNAACDSSGFGQGKTFLHSISVTTGANCIATFGDNPNITNADLSVSLGYDHTKFSSFVEPSQAFSYQAVVKNNGVATAAGVSLTDTLPASEVFVSATATQGTCSAIGNALTCNLGSLASGATALVTINVTVTGVGTITNTVTTASTTPDSTSGNNSASLNLSGVYSPAIIDHFSPASDVAGTGPLVLTIFGFTFYQGVTTVTANSTTLSYTLLNNQTCGTVFQPDTCQALQVTLPAALTATAGAITIALNNPTPGGGGDSMGFTIYPNLAGTTHFGITGVPNPAVQNTPYNMTVTALDASGHVVTAYQGTVQISGQFLGSPTLNPPSPYQFTPADQGAHTFSTTFVYAEDETVTVTDSGTPTVTGVFNLTVNPLLGPPSRLIGGSTPDSVPIGFPFPQPLSVTVTDASGNLLPNITVTFTNVSLGSAAACTFSNGQSSIQLVTDANGSVSTVITANQTAGQFQVNATVGSLVTQWFPTSNNNVPAHITIVDGNPQSGPINTQFAGILDVKVTDAQNNPVKEVPVTFSAPTSGASLNFTSTTAVTSQFNAGFVHIGEARLDPIGVANGIAGTYKVTATAGTASVQFDFTNTPTPSTVASMDIRGTPQVTAVHTQFASKLGVIPRDSKGNCLAQVPITYTAPASGASATFSSNTANSDPTTCLAQVTATANGVAGGPYNVTATAPGGVSVTFALTNTSGVTTVTATSGTPQSASIGTNFLLPLQVTLVDPSGNPLANQTINFTAPTSGASAVLSGSSATTDSSGSAEIFATANNTLGSYSVTATFGGSTATFQLTNIPPPAALSIQKSHTGSFALAQSGAVYTVVVSNALSAGPTTGAVTVTDYLPTGLTLQSIAGDNWTCSNTTATCSRSNTLLAGASYPSITVTVAVAANAPPSLTNQAGVTGGGSLPANASDLTVIKASPCDVHQDGVLNVLDDQTILQEALGRATAVHDLNGDASVNVLDVQIVINAAMGLGCSAH